MKRIEFVTRRAGTAPDDFAAAWRASLARRVDTPPDVRPYRVALGVALHTAEHEPRYDGVYTEWFDDSAHLARFEAWRAAGGRDRGSDAAVDRGAGAVVVVEEVVLRGEEWLRERWREGGPRCKHMALARRADHLTPAEFSRQWRRRAGVLSRPDGPGVVAIPEAVKGQAYVQNHPVARGEGEWDYDAVNEVYFDDPAALQRRVAWVAASLTDRRAEADLVGDRHFLSVREELLAGSSEH